MTQWLLHLFFPNRCPFCARCILHTAHACDDCAKSIVALPTIWAQVGEFPAYARFFYEDGVALAIQDLKFHSNLLNAEHLGVLLSEGLPDAEQLGVTLVTYIPMHSKQQRLRGFNQAEEIAKSLAKHRNLPLRPTLQKIRQTKSQHTLNRKERATNLEGAFAVISPRSLTDQHVLLIDDVCTTGETSRRSAALLEQAGAASVTIATVAKTSSRSPTPTEPDATFIPLDDVIHTV